jgi:hypothetical protein
LAIQAVEDVLIRVRQALDEYGTIDIDCRDATEVDASFIQLLLAARVSAERRGKVLRVLTGDGVMLAALDAGGFLTLRDGCTENSFWISERR